MKKPAQPLLVKKKRLPDEMTKKRVQSYPSRQQLAYL